MAGDDPGRDLALVHGFVHQQHAADDIADGEDVLIAGTALLVQAHTVDVTGWRSRMACVRVLPSAPGRLTRSWKDEQRGEAGDTDQHPGHVIAQMTGVDAAQGVEGS